MLGAEITGIKDVVLPPQDACGMLGTHIGGCLRPAGLSRGRKSSQGGKALSVVPFLPLQSSPRAWSTCSQHFHLPSLSPHSNPGSKSPWKSKSRAIQFLAGMWFLAEPHTRWRESLASNAFHTANAAGRRSSAIPCPRPKTVRVQVQSDSLSDVCGLSCESGVGRMGIPEIKR